ncbi:MAG: EcsC family protein [Stagnimonas sp.]|nr:EcsC family protein [Stagnimonas sp.]
MTATPADTALFDAVVAWRDRTAHPDLRGLPVVNVPALSRVRNVVPEGAARRTLAAAYTASVRVSQPKALLRQAGVESIEALRAKPLPDCDALARKTARQAGWLAGGSGAALGVAGAAGLVADAPALMLIALRTLVRIGYCYGERPSPTLVAALFALASADTEDEKRLAWQAALTAPAGQDSAPGVSTPGITDAAVRDGLERAAEREFAKQALTGSLQKLSSTMVQRLGMKKAAGLLPLVGAVVGGAVNIRFVYLLSEAARMAFAARRFRHDGMPLEKLLARAPLLAAARKEPVQPKKPVVRKAATVAAKTKSGKPTRRRPARVP